jgi:hypothetical protein
VNVVSKNMFKRSMSTLVTPHELATCNRRSGTKMHLILYCALIDEKIRTTVDIRGSFRTLSKSYLGPNGLFCKHMCLILYLKNKSAYAQGSQADSRNAASKLPFLSASNVGLPRPRCTEVICRASNA